MQIHVALDDGSLQPHWLDIPEFAPRTPRRAPVQTYIIKEPDSLPLPNTLTAAVKIGEFGATGIYQLQE